MKIAISLPDDLFADADARARRLKVSRSRLIAVAVREYLDRHGAPVDATEEWNRALAASRGEDEATAQAVRRYTRALVRKGTAW